MKKLKTLKQIQLYKDKWSTIVQDIIDLNSDTKIIYTYVKRANGVGAIVINDINEILLIKQYRPPVEQYSWEIPGGGIDEGEDLETAIKREVLEETGIKIQIIESWGTSYPMPSLASEKGYLFLAKTTDSIPDKIHGESDELIKKVCFIPLRKALKMIESGEIIDASTAMTILRYALNKKVRPEPDSNR